MNSTRIILKNITVLSISNLLGSALSFLFIIYAARYLGVEGYGILSFALAFTGLFSVLIDMGLNPVIVREVARDKHSTTKYLENVLILKIILGILTLGLIMLVINLLGHPEKIIRVVYIIALSTVFVTFINVFYSIFQAHEKMEYQAIGEILRNCIMFLGALFAIKYEFDIISFVLIYPLSSATVLGYAFILYLQKFHRPKIEIDLNLCKFLIKEALPFALSSIFIMVYYYIDTIMLSLMIPNPDKTIGWYNAAYRLIRFLIIIPRVYFSSVYPVMSRFSITSREFLKFLYERSFKYMTIIAIPIGIGVSLLSNDIILYVYNQEYLPASIALKILIWSVVFIFMSQPAWNLLNSLNKQIIGTKVTAIGAILNIVLNFILIPKFSYIGASISTVATEFFVLIALIFVTLKTEYKINKEFLISIVLKTSISSLVMGIFILYFEDGPLLLLIISAKILYFTIFYALGGFDKYDQEIFKKITSNSK